MRFALCSVKQIGLEIGQNGLLVATGCREHRTECVVKLCEELSVGRIPFVDHLLEFADRLGRFAFQSVALNDPDLGHLLVFQRYDIRQLGLKHRLKLGLGVRILFRSHQRLALQKTPLGFELRKRSGRQATVVLGRLVRSSCGHGQIAHQLGCGVKLIRLRVVFDPVGHQSQGVFRIPFAFDGQRSCDVPPQELVVLLHVLRGQRSCIDLLELLDGLLELPLSDQVLGPRKGWWLPLIEDS